MPDIGPGASLVVPDWPAPACVRAFTTTRLLPGNSLPPYDACNLGLRSGEDASTVQANRALLERAFKLPSPPRWLKQVHGTRVATFGTSGNDPDTPHPNPPPQAGEGDATKVRHASTSERCNANHRSQAGQVDALDRTARGQRIAHHFPPPQAGEGWGGGNRLLRGGDWPPRDEPEADAAITRDAGVVLAILTADCLPVLLCSDDGAVVGAAHAGWRGLVGGVLERSVAAMGVDPARILAWLGPAAGPQAYEVGVEVRSAFVKPDAQAAIAFVATRPGHWLCDLYALARRRLMLAGVQRVYGGGLCTITDARRFYSFRRDGARSGRMASLICINEPVGGG